MCNQTNVFNDFASSTKKNMDVIWELILGGNWLHFMKSKENCASMKPKHNWRWCILIEFTLTKPNTDVIWELILCWNWSHCMKSKENSIYETKTQLEMTPTQSSQFNKTKHSYSTTMREGENAFGRIQDQFETPGLSSWKRCRHKDMDFSRCVNLF